MPHWTGRFPLMDSLRAIAALAIVGYHVAPLAGAFHDSFLTAAAALICTEVALFFVISGFLLYRPFVVAHAAGERLPSVRAYAWRRFLRIAPAYWVALTATGLLLAPEVFDRPLLFYGFAQIYSPGAVFDGIPVAWTLCIEVTFYAFLPLFAVLLRAVARRAGGSVWRAEAWALVALFAFGIGWRWLALTADGGVLQTSLNTLPAYLDWFAVGMGLAVMSAWLGADGAKPGFVSLVERAPGACWAVALAALVAAAWVFDRRYFGGERSDFALLAVHVCEMLCGLAMILPAAFDGGAGAVRRLLAWPVLLWLGMVSYGIYLWQAAALHGLADVTPLHNDVLDATSVWWVPVGFAGCVVAGALSWYILERPVLSLKRLVGPRKAEEVSPALDEAAARVAP